MKVLLVEDESTLAGFVRKGLESLGCVVDLASDGLTGEWLAAENPYDAIVLDLMLPQLNGYDVLRSLRRRGVLTPVLVLTAKDGEHDQIDAFDLGADDFLSKPFSFPVLVARLRALARRGPTTRPLVLEVGDIRLDPRTRSVSRAGVPVQLTVRETALLEYLMSRSGEVVPKTDILDAVWDSAFDGSDNVVEVYVRYLRRKLDEPFATRSIETVRGSGYRLLSSTASALPAQA